MINSQIEILTQAQSYLTSVSSTDYSAVIKPNFISSSGAHIRHIVDHYVAIMTGLKKQLIDFDYRSRGNIIETHPDKAYDKIKNIITWLTQLSDEELQQELMLSTEVSISNKKVCCVKTNLARELIFAGSHAVHHYAMISQIQFAQVKLAQIEPIQYKNNDTEQIFGLAPATATHMRNTKQTCCN